MRGYFYIYGIVRLTLRYAERNCSAGCIWSCEYISIEIGTALWALSLFMSALPVLCRQKAAYVPLGVSCIKGVAL